jgi:hypothetical protein
MQLFRRDVAVAAIEQQAGQRQTLTGGAQAGGTQAVEGLAIRAHGNHGHDVGLPHPGLKGVIIPERPIRRLKSINFFRHDAARGQVRICGRCMLA